MRRLTRAVALAAASAVMLPLAACGSGGSGGTGDKPTSGPIKIWTSTNKQEIDWAQKVVAAWNAQHADQQVTAQVGSVAEVAIAV